MRIMTIPLALAVGLALGSLQPALAQSRAPLGPGPCLGPPPEGPFPPAFPHCPQNWSDRWGSYMGVPFPCFPGYPIEPCRISCIRERGTYHCCPQLYSPYHVRMPMPPEVAGKAVLDHLYALGVPRKLIDAEKASDKPAEKVPELAPKPKEEKPDERKPDERKPDERKPEDGKRTDLPLSSGNLRETRIP
jgi:hypothetical protein